LFAAACNYRFARTANADVDVLVASHRRHWAEVRRRRERYGYGVVGRIRELLGER
jgi:hypothetical protein